MSESFQGGPDGQDVARLLRDLLTECGSVAEVLELFYLTREPDLLPALRAMLRAPVHVRGAITDFVAQLPDPVHMDVLTTGMSLTLTAMPPRH